MDPRSSIAEARQLGLKPPARPAAATPAPVDDIAESDKGAAATVPSGRRPRRARATARQPRAVATETGELPGFARGNRRALTVSLPRATLVALRQASEASAMGETVVEALRSCYGWLVETYRPQSVETVGPFPASVRQRRRRQVEDPSTVHLYMSPAEAAAVAQVADECELSISELVTIGLDHHLSAPAPKTAPPPRRPDRPKKLGGR